MIALALAMAMVARADAPSPLVQWTFDESDGDFTSAGSTGQWEWGTITSGPRSAYTGATAWATVVDGLYLNDAEDYLQLPSYDLSAASRPIIQFRHWYATEEQVDVGRVEVWTGLSWEAVEPVYGYPFDDGYSGVSNGWERAWVDLTGLSTDASEVRFAFRSDERVALEGWYIDDVMIFDGDPVPPEIELTVTPEDTQDLDGPYVVEAAVRDDSSAVDVVLTWQAAGATHTVAMTDQNDGTWRAEIPAQEPDTTVSWWIDATDGSNSAVAPEDGEGSFRVYLAAPTELTGPDGRIVGVEADLSWTAPDSPHEVQGYIVYRDGEAVAASTGTSVAAPLSGPLDTFEVSAVYEAGEGDRSSPLSLRVHVPEVESLDPAEAWQGEALRVTVTGQDLLFTDADAAISLGDGVTVLDTEVVDAGRAVFTLSLDEDAATGPRDVTVTSGAVALTLSSAFEVRDGADRPALTSVSPETVSRGDEVELRFQTNHALDAAPEVDLGDGLIVQRVTLDGQVVCVSAAVELDAELGERWPVVDDGVHLLDGVPLKVVYDAGAPKGSCAAARGGGWASLLALGALALRRRVRAASCPREG